MIRKNSVSLKSDFEKKDIAARTIPGRNVKIIAGEEASQTESPALK